MRTPSRRAGVAAALVLATALWVGAGPSPAPTPAPPVSPDLSRVNDALGAWLELIDADRPFLVLDGSAGVLRLHHGEALLRVDTVVAMVPGPAGVQRLQDRLRRLRRTDPFHEVEPGPFDWDHALVTAAGPDAALRFDGGLLVYADAAWEPVPRPFLRLPTRAVRALYDAVADSTALVVLPEGWDALAEGDSP